MQDWRKAGGRDEISVVSYAYKRSIARVGTAQGHVRPWFDHDATALRAQRHRLRSPAAEAVSPPGHDGHSAAFGPRKEQVDHENAQSRADQAITSRAHQDSWFPACRWRQAHLEGRAAPGASSEHVALRARSIPIRLPGCGRTAEFPGQLRTVPVRSGAAIGRPGPGCLDCGLPVAANGRRA